MPSSPMVKALLRDAGMRDAFDAKVAEQVRRSIRKDTGRKAAPGIVWPGTPSSIFPLVFTPTLNAMVRRGEIEYVSSPSVTRPGRQAHYYRFAQR